MHVPICSLLCVSFFSTCYILAVSDRTCFAYVKGPVEVVSPTEESFTFDVIQSRWKRKGSIGSEGLTQDSMIGWIATHFVEDGTTARNKATLVSYDQTFT
jgi:hypothetical protein